MKPILRVCVPCPNHHSVHPLCNASIEQLKSLNEEFIVELVRVVGTAISHQRCEGVHLKTSNLVYQDNYKEEFDYYLALDADISFEPDNVRKLLSLDLDIVGGAYRARKGLDRFVAGDFVPGEKYVSPDYFLSQSCRGLIKVDWIGMGFTLIKRDVFRKMRFPWWREAFTESIDKTDNKLHAYYLGDDIGFCLNAQETGYDIYCDCDTIVKHHTE